MRIAKRSLGPLASVLDRLTRAVSMIASITWLRIVIAVALTVGVTWVSLKVYYDAVAGFSSAAQIFGEWGLALLTVIIAAVVTALVEARHDRKRALLATIVLGYLGTRALSMGIHYPGSLNSWAPYPLLGWLAPEWIPLVLIVLQVWLLRPLYPGILRAAGLVRRFFGRLAAHVPLLRDAAHARRLAGLLVCGLVFISWDGLNGAVGTASAAFLCALALVGVMLLVGDRKYLLFGIVACAGFLAVSALAQAAPPNDVLVQGSFSTPEIDFGIAPPKGINVNVSGLQLTITMVPLVPTLFHCPSQVDIGVFLDDQDNKVQEQLSGAKYALNVPGRAVIQLPDASRVAMQYIVAGPNGAPTTQMFGSGLDVGDRPDAYDESFGDGFIFTAPLQSWRSMGTCYIVIPTVDANTEPAGYSVIPAKTTVQLTPWRGSSLDLTDTRPQPTADQVTQGAFDWTCYDFSGLGTQGSAQCPAVSVVTANWANSYTQVAMLLVGTLIAIAAERWFNLTKLDEESSDPIPRVSR